MAPFVPEQDDVHSVRSILRGCKLPNELIMAIIDHARYWVEREESRAEHKVLMDEEFSQSFSAACPYYAMPAFPIRYSTKSELPKIKEVEFLVVSHDQGWTTEDTKGSYQTSSWFEVSVIRPTPSPQCEEAYVSIRAMMRRLNSHDGFYQDIGAIKDATFQSEGIQLLPRSFTNIEPQRLHCNEMINVTKAKNESSIELDSQNAREGEYAWWLQANEVARGTSIFDGEMVRRYNIVWGSRSNPNWVGNEGSGQGEGFVDSLQEDDWIVIWARAKRRGWENHIHGVRMIIRATI